MSSSSQQQWQSADWDWSGWDWGVRLVAVVLDQSGDERKAGFSADFLWLSLLGLAKLQERFKAPLQKNGQHTNRPRKFVTKNRNQDTRRDLQEIASDLHLQAETNIAKLEKTENSRRNWNLRSKIDDCASNLKIREKAGKIAKNQENSANQKLRLKTEYFAKKEPGKNRGMEQNLPKMQFCQILMWKVVAWAFLRHILLFWRVFAVFMPFLCRFCAVSLSFHLFGEFSHAILDENADRQCRMAAVAWAGVQNWRVRRRQPELLRRFWPLGLVARHQFCHHVLQARWLGHLGWLTRLFWQLPAKILQSVGGWFCFWDCETRALCKLTFMMTEAKRSNWHSYKTAWDDKAGRWAKRTDRPRIEQLKNFLNQRVKP